MIPEKGGSMRWLKKRLKIINESGVEEKVET